MDDQKFSWPKSEKDVRSITQTQFEWLLQGIEIDQKRHFILWISHLKTVVFRKVIHGRNDRKCIDFT